MIAIPTSSRESIAADASAVLGLEEIRHEYGEVTAIDLLSLSVAEGEVVCLLGPWSLGWAIVAWNGWLKKFSNKLAAIADGSR